MVETELLKEFWRDFISDFKNSITLTDLIYGFMMVAVLLQVCGFTYFLPIEYRAWVAFPVMLIVFIGGSVLHYNNELRIPKIEHIDQVLPAIKFNKEFNVVKRGPYTVINYQIVQDGTFPDIKTSGGSEEDRLKKEYWKKVKRECRGLIFDKDGNILARRYHKFFNMNEREETKQENINWDEPHILLEKIDGSMVSPIILSDKIYWTTKMGITDIAGDVQALIGNGSENLEELIRISHEANATLIFEWVSKKSKVILDYPEDKLILTAIRHNVLGTYINYGTMTVIANMYNVPVVQPLVVDLKNVSALENIEGVVVRFDSGHMVKVKTDWYVLRHRSKDTILREKGVLEYILNDQVDDILPYLSDDDKSKLMEFQANIFAGIQKTTENLLLDFMKYRKMTGFDRKRFALEIAPTLHHAIRALMFEFLKQHEYGQVNGAKILVDFLKGNISTNDKVEAVRHLWGYHRWKY